MLRFYQIFKGLDTNSCLFKETDVSESMGTPVVVPLGPALTVLVPDSWHFVVTFPQLTLVLWMPLRAACVVVVRRGGVVDVAATLVVLWLFVMRRGNPDRFVNCGKSVLAFWDVQTIWNRRDEICNGALYFGTTYKKAFLI